MLQRPKQRAAVKKFSPSTSVLIALATAVEEAVRDFLADEEASRKHPITCFFSDG
jgi:hypothetical protein